MLDIEKQQKSLKVEPTRLVKGLSIKLFWGRDETPSDNRMNFQFPGNISLG